MTINRKNVAVALMVLATSVSAWSCEWKKSRRPKSVDDGIYGIRLGMTYSEFSDVFEKQFPARSAACSVRGNMAAFRFSDLIGCSHESASCVGRERRVIAETTPDLYSCRIHLQGSDSKTMATTFTKTCGASEIDGRLMSFYVDRQVSGHDEIESLVAQLTNKFGAPRVSDKSVVTYSWDDGKVEAYIVTDILEKHVIEGVAYSKLPKNSHCPFRNEANDGGQTNER